MQSDSSSCLTQSGLTSLATSISSDEEWAFEPTLSNNDFKKFKHVLNIDWKQRFSISPQISHSASPQPFDDDITYRIHRRSILSDSSNNLNYSCRNHSSSPKLRYYSSYKQQRPRRPLSFDNGDFDYSYTKHHYHLDNNTAYIKLKNFTERLLEIERKAREKRWINNQTSTNKNIQKSSTSNNRKFSSEYTEKINKQYGLCVQDVVNCLNRRRNSKSITTTIVNEVQMETTSPTTTDRNADNGNIFNRFLNEKRKRSLNSDEQSITLTQNPLIAHSLSNGDPRLKNCVASTPFHDDTDVRKAKIRRIQSDPVLVKQSRRSPRQNLRKIKTMPAMMITNYTMLKLKEQSNSLPTEVSTVNDTDA
ncbi:unnamed protein product [Didymodactylos carnosus]|uniref:Uncharacterized protein n=1 Tax=Didymodactylos carnosus TaxID=1234261 RepID=A0A814TCF7_9BILA|nr:unnamed protein product [Didymodactylos carnosus]CAF3921607.1 unnamed protein product [Didymodactylos carnosus]